MRQLLFILTLFAGVIAGAFYLESIDPTGTLGEYPFALESADVENPTVVDSRSESELPMLAEANVVPSSADSRRPFEESGTSDEKKENGVPVNPTLDEEAGVSKVSMPVGDDRPEATSTPEPTSTSVPTTIPTTTPTPILPVQQISRVKPSLTPSPTIVPTDPPPTLTPFATPQPTIDTAEDVNVQPTATTAEVNDRPAATPTATSQPSAPIPLVQGNETPIILSPTPNPQAAGGISSVLVSDNYRGESIITAVVRAGPSTDYEVIDLVRPGTWLPVSGLTGTGWGTWFYVETPKGRTGWISIQVALPPES